MDGWTLTALTVNFDRRSSTVRPTEHGCEADFVGCNFSGGFTCHSGAVMPNQSVAGYTSIVLGGNVSAGFTIKVGDPSCSIYIEPRCHYAPTKTLNTHLMEITFVIRY